MKQIQDRSDINLLVNSFYIKIRTNELLDPIFNKHIFENEWILHTEKLTDFWETNLFGKPVFKGNPTQKHIQVDYNLNHTINQDHFAVWLKIWFETIDELFVGEIAEKAKEASKRMASNQFLAIIYNRSDND